MAAILEREDGFTIINAVEWGKDDASDLDELAARPKPDRSDDPCGCTRDDGVMTCNDLSCVLFACQEECRSNCYAGEFCGNKRIQRRQWKSFEVFDAGKKGRGLRILEDVKKGDLITEYCGRAVNRKFLPRLFQRYGNERKLYIMALDKDIYLDARSKGSLARYINHSCEPNCVVERWKVRGILRAAVIASKDIPANTELSFDYQWERKRGRAPTKCHCGKPTCRGTLEVARSMEEEEMERKLSDHWKKPFMLRPKKEIVNRCVKIFSKETQEYYTGDVTSYDPETGKHLILYKHDLEEVWEDLKQEDWMLLDEEAEQFIIKKKATPSHQQQDESNTLTSQSLLQSQQQQQQQQKANYTSNLPNVLLQGRQQMGKNYVYVQTHIKEALTSKHLIERCQRSCRVTITPEHCHVNSNTDLSALLEMERRERDNAMQISKDGSVWKLSIVGYDIPKALSILEKNVSFIERKFFSDMGTSIVAGNSALSASINGGMKYNGTSEIAPAVELPSTEVILPRCIVESAKRRLPSLRDKCRSVNITFVPSESKSKQFAKLVLEGTLKSDVNAAKEHLWQQLNVACQEQKAPKTPSGLYKDLCFLGGEMSSADFLNLLEYDKTGMASAVYKSTRSPDAKEDLTRWSPFFTSFEATQRCAIWIQSDEDKGRINSDNRLVNEATPNAPRKIYFGCEPGKVSELWGLVKHRAQEVGRGVKYLYLGSDRLYQPMMMKQGSHFFDFVRKVTGASVEVDSMTGDHLRIDGRGKNKTVDITGDPADKISEGERAGLAEEVIRLQIELFRDHCIRQQNWMFGRDWTLAKRSAGQSSNKRDSSLSVTASRSLSPRSLSPIPGSTSSSSRYNSFDSKMLTNACVEISDIVSTLGLDGGIAAHAAVIIYRFSVMLKTSSTGTQLKIREALLASVFLANKAQKVSKFKSLETVLEAAYASFYPGVSFDPKKEEALVWQDKVIAAESEILETLNYDLFWNGFNWIEVAAVESKCLSRDMVKNVVALSVSGSVLAAGADVWLGYGPEHVFAAAAGFLGARLDGLFPALNLIPIKVSQVAELLAKSMKSTPGGKRQKWDRQVLREMAKKLPSIKDTCNKCLIISLNLKNNRPQTLPEMEQRYKLIGDRCRKRRNFRRVPSPIVNEFILPVLDGICAESNCNIFVEQSTESGLNNVVLEGSWRALSIASYLLEESVQGHCRLEKSEERLADSAGKNVESKGEPGLLEMKKIETVDAWMGTVQSEITNQSYWGRKTGGKCCIPGKIKESVLRQGGLRWWLPPRYGPSPTGSICDMFIVNNNASDALDALANLTRTFQGESAAFSMLTSSFAKNVSPENGVGDRFVAISLQRWPTEKVAKREQMTLEKKKDKNVSKKKRKRGEEGQAIQMGFSAGALQEMQLLHRLHGLIKSPQGHPNFILPVGVALPSQVEKNDADLNTNGSKSLDLKRIDEDIEDIFSLTRTSLENEVAAQNERKRKDMSTGPHLVFHATPFILARFAPGKRKRENDVGLVISPEIFGAWVHDLISALQHCHSNDIVLRNFQLDQIVVDHSGVAKIGGLYRASELSGEDKRTDFVTSALSRKKWQEGKHKRADADILTNLNAAPEMLLGSTKYTKESDIWTLGCLLANLLLNKALFSGKDIDSRLMAMFKMIGTPSSENLPEAVKFPNYSKPKKKYRHGVSKALHSMMGPDEGAKYAGAIDLIDKMLQLDPRKRITAVGALQHEYMQSFIEQSASRRFQEDFVKYWISLKKTLMRSSQNKEDEIEDREQGIKRKAMLMAASTTAPTEEEDDDDDLYNMGDILEPANKLQKL